MSEFLDETFEERENREKFEYFFGQYSSDVRKKLLSKNIERPENIYDILYSKVRENLLSKNNTSFSSDIEENAKKIRNNQLSQIIAKQIDLDKTGETIRQAQIAKTKLLESSIDLNNLSDSVRNKMLSNNVDSSVDIDKASEIARNNNLSQNQISNINLEETADKIRSVSLSKNDENNIDLDNISERERNKQLRTNVSDNLDLDKLSEAQRKNSESKNIKNEIDLDKRAEEIKDTQIAKNDVKNIDLDSNAQTFRDGNIFKNNSKEIDLDKIADNARSVNESFNKEKNINLDKSADVSREKILSANIDSQNDLDKTADIARKNQLTEKENNYNIDRASESIRKNQLATNKESEINLDSAGENIRKNQLSSNKESEINLDSKSERLRNNLLSSNGDKKIDLEKDSQTPRNNLLASNAPTNIDLDKDSQVPRNNLLASNVPANIDLDNDSKTPRNNLLASNVPTNIDLDNDSKTPRNNLLASNVPTSIDLDKSSKNPRNNLLASNVPTNVDLDANAALTRGGLLAANSPNDTDLDKDSEKVRQSLLSQNQTTFNSLDNDASDVRNSLLAANVPKDINVERHADAIRNTLLAANDSSENPIEDIAGIFRHDLLSKNARSRGLGTNLYFGGTSMFIGVSNLEIISAPIRELTKLRNKLLNKNNNLQKDYGVETNGQGIPIAKITNAIQLYNLQKNPFMPIRYSEKTSGYSVLLNHNADGFQQLLSLGANISAEIKVATNTTPSDVIIANQGVYVGLPTTEDGTSPVTVLLKPEGNKTVLGNAESMMGNTLTTDMIEKNFNLKSRGVSHIINTIRKAGSKIPLANNYNSQTNSKFLIGDNKYAYSRYTIANPYQPNKDAGFLELRIKNYAIANGNPSMIHTMSFPPYVKAFANSDSANWNKIDFLGRPEAIYTYSNSSREGSLSFYVLTDYAQVVDIGYDYTKSKPLTENFTKNFTDSNNKKDVKSNLEVEIAKRQDTIAAINTQLADIEDSDVANIANLRLQIVEEQLQVNNLQAKLKNIQSGSDIGPNRNYKEFDAINGNVYKSLIMNSAERDTNGNINLTTEETAKRLARMKKDMLFQPAYFSGDKVDFLTRMEFLSKLTRPSRSSSGKTGFSFTFPPVCHLHLGDWFNHDIIINNVSYDYSDAPWTIDGLGGRTQPMWALVSLSFNIVGSYGGRSGENVPLATDRGGFYQRRSKKG